MRNHARTILLVAVAALAVPAITGTRPALAADVKEDISDGDKAYEDGKFAKAAAAYDRAIKNAPKQVPAAVYGKRASIFLILASKARAANKDAEAQAQLEAGLKFISQVAEPVYPTAAEVLEQKALILWQLKSKPDAIKAAEQAVQQDDKLYAAQAIIGEFYSIRDPGRSIKAYEAYLANRPKNLEDQDVMPRIHLGFAYLSQARKLRNASKEDVASDAAGKARGQFENLLQKHRDARNAEVNAQNGLCAAYTFLGQFDRAITVCEKIIENPRAIDRGGSVYFNLGQAYLQKKQGRKARTVGQEYIRMRKSEARGYILVGDSFAVDRNWNGALEWYQKAEELAKSNKDYAADVGIKLGIAYRGAGKSKLAIEKLVAARANDPDNREVISQLGLAYLADGQDEQALATVTKGIDKLRKDIEADKIDLDAQDNRELKNDLTGMLTVAGKAAYNLAAFGDGKPEVARDHFEAAYKLDNKNAAVRTGLVKTLTLQAYQSFKKKNVKAAEASLKAALGYDKKNAAASQDMAALAISRGDCDEARGYVAALENERSYALIYHRLMGRLALCSKQRDVKSAIEHYAAADKVAGNANLVRAEIYTEWGPLIWDKDLDEAIDKLEAAVQFTAQNPELGKPAQRALSLALFRRGWRTMRGGKKVADPVDDFARASRDPSVLKGTERQAFEFSEALARLDKGDSTGAIKIFDALAKQGNQGAYLKSPYDRVGAQFFGAYAKYRGGNAGQLKQAASEFTSLASSAKGSFGEKVRDLQASCYEQLAFDAIESGNDKTARGYLDSAAKYASSGAAKKRINHNRAVLSMGSKASKALLDTFSAMGSDPPEALVNKGILLDREGRTKDAYDAWVQARSKGARGKQLDGWIATKKRIFGY